MKIQRDGTKLERSSRLGNIGSTCWNYPLVEGFGGTASSFDCFEEVCSLPNKTVEGGQGNRKRVTFEDEAGGPRRDGSGSSDDVKGRVVGTEKNKRNKGRVDYKKLAGL